MKKDIEFNFGYYSEVGKLQLVLTHRIGGEINRLSPDLLKIFLFNYVPDAEIFRRDHDFFIKKLKENGVKVLYFFDLLSEVLENDLHLKNLFIEKFLNQVSDLKKTLFPKIKTIFILMNTKVMLYKMLQGFEAHELGVKNFKRVFLIPPISNFIYLNDLLRLIFNHFIIFNMKNVIRKRETLFIEFFLKHQMFENEKKIFYQNFSNDSIEGGDILVLQKKIIVVAVTKRTRWNAVEKFAFDLFKNYPQNKFKIVIIEFFKKNFIHFVNVFKQIDEDKFIIYKKLFENKENFIIWEYSSQNEKKLIDLTKITFQNYFEKILQRKIKFISCGGFSKINQKREQATLATNVLVLKKGTIFAYDCNRITNQLLRNQKLKVIEIPSGELKFGGGGLSCMLIPLRRYYDSK